MLRNTTRLFRGAFNAPYRYNNRSHVRSYWQQVIKGDKVYYVDTDTFEKTTEKPEEYVPHEAMESRLVRYALQNWFIISIFLIF